MRLPLLTRFTARMISVLTAEPDSFFGQLGVEREARERLIEDNSQS